MLSRLWRRAYGPALVCLAVLVAIALVACETPAPGVAAPTVSEELPDISSLAADTSRNVGLSNAFNGEKLEYSVRSNNLGVAIAQTDDDNRSIVIRAIGPGTATITATATNSGGSATQSFKVTVPRPTPVPTPVPTPEPTLEPTSDNPSDCPSSLPRSGGMFKVTLEITRGLSGKCTLPANHSLIYDYNDEMDDDLNKKVSVYGPGEGNVWTITALKKGRPVVKINNDQTGETEGEITVIVPNTPPRLTRSEPVGDGTDDLMPGQNEATYAYITNNLNPGGHFEDVDPEDDPTDAQGAQGFFRFKVLQKPDGVVIDTDRGFVAVRVGDTGEFNSDLTNGPINMRAVILKNPNPDATPPDDTFDILLHAYDRDNDESDNPVTLRFKARDPQAGSYSVERDDDGKFKTLTIGNRIGVEHTIDFDTNGLTNGFDFVSGSDVDEDLEGRIPASPSHTLANQVCDPRTGPSADWLNTAGIGDGCFSARAQTNDVEITGIGVPQQAVDFQLDPDHRGLNETSGATITIAYHVVALKRSTLPDGETFANQDPEDMKIESKWKKTLRLDIHRCVETTDCP